MDITSPFKRSGKGSYDIVSIADAAAAARPEWRLAVDTLKRNSANSASLVQYADLFFACSATLAEAGICAAAVFVAETGLLISNLTSDQESHNFLISLESLESAFHFEMDRLSRGQICCNKNLTTRLQAVHSEFRLKAAFPRVALMTPALPVPLWCAYPAVATSAHGLLSSFEILDFFESKKTGSSLELCFKNAESIAGIRSHLLAACHLNSRSLSLAAFCSVALLDDYLFTQSALPSRLVDKIAYGARIFSTQTHDKPSTWRSIIEAVSFAADILLEMTQIADQGSSRKVQYISSIASHTYEPNGWGTLRPYAIEESWNDFSNSLEKAMATARISDLAVAIDVAVKIAAHGGPAFVDSATTSGRLALFAAGMADENERRRWMRYATESFATLKLAARCFSPSEAFDLCARMANLGKLAMKSWTIPNTFERGPFHPGELFEIVTEASRELSQAMGSIIRSSIGAQQSSIIALRQCSLALPFSTPVFPSAALASECFTLTAELIQNGAHSDRLLAAAQHLKLGVSIGQFDPDRANELINRAFAALNALRNHPDTQAPHWNPEFIQMLSQEADWTLGLILHPSKAPIPSQDSQRLLKSLLTTCSHLARLSGSRDCALDLAQAADAPPHDHHLSIAVSAIERLRASLPKSTEAATSHAIGQDIDPSVLDVIAVEAPKMIKHLLGQADSLRKTGPAFETTRLLHSVANLADLLGASRLADAARPLEIWSETTTSTLDLDLASLALQELSLLLDSARLLNDGLELHLPSLDNALAILFQEAMASHAIPPAIPEIKTDRLPSLESEAEQANIVIEQQPASNSNPAHDEYLESQVVELDFSDNLDEADSGIFDLLESSLLEALPEPPQPIDIKPPAASGQNSFASPAHTSAMRLPYFKPQCLANLDNDTVFGLPNGSLAWPSEQEMEDDLDPTILHSFMGEAHDLVVTMEKIILDFVPGGTSFAELNRMLHTIKGGARMAGAMRLGQFIHHLEDMTLNDVSNVAEAKALIRACSLGVEASRETLAHLTEGFAAHMAAAAGKDMADAAKSNVEDSSFRIRASQINSVAELIGEMRMSSEGVNRLAVSVSSTIRNFREPIRRLSNISEQIMIEAETSIDSGQSQKVETQSEWDALHMDRFTKLHQLTRQLSEAVADISQVSDTVDDQSRSVEDAVIRTTDLAEEARKHIDDIGHIDVMSIQPRARAVIRQAMSDAGKTVRIVFVGGAKIDRHLLDLILPPIEHILRNALAHGIEPLHDRRLNGKSDEGTITVSVKQDGQYIDLAISDDGQGVNLEVVERKARQKGLIQATETKPSEARILSMLFEPGFSTADSVNEMAGRGVGLDVVSDTMKRVGGRATLTQQRGQGATFQLRVPLSITQTSGVILFVGSPKKPYIVPSAYVDKIEIASAKDISASLADPSIEVTLGDARSQRKIIWLGSMCGLAHAPKLRHFNKALLIHGSPYAIFAEEMETISQTPIKPFPPIIPPSTGLIATGLLHDGSTAVVLEPNEALRLYLSNRTNRVQDIQDDDKTKLAPLIMIVDDSITIRTYSSKSLSKSGFRTVTAENGLVCLEKLREMDEVPSVILMDIEMPVMDGFHATETIRNDVRYNEVKIIFISSRNSDTHKKRAADLGANDFLGKPYNLEHLLTLLPTAEPISG